MNLLKSFARITSYAMLFFCFFSITLSTSAQRLDCSYGTNGVVQIAFPASYNAPAVMAFDVYQSGPHAGKVVVVFQYFVSGVVTNPNGTFTPENRDFAVVRINANGTVDNTFGTNGYTSGVDFDRGVEKPVAIFAMNDGKVVVGGQSDGPLISGGPQQGVFGARFTSTGVLDNSYSGNGKFKHLPKFNGQQNQAGSEWHGGTIQPDGKMLICGRTNGSGSDSWATVARVNANGGMDNTFTSNGYARVNFVREGVQVRNVEPFYEVALDGTKVIAAGVRSNSATPRNEHFIFARFNSNGSTDNSFSTDGKETFQIAPGIPHNIVGLHADGGKMLATYDISGITPDFFSALRLNNGGGLDMTYGTNGYVSVDVATTSGDGTDASALQSDGQLLIVGNPGGGDDIGAIRLSSSGATDPNFGNGGETLVNVSGLGSPRAAVIQADGKLLVLGSSGGIDLTRIETVTGTPDCTTGVIPPVVAVARCKNVNLDLVGTSVSLSPAQVNNGSIPSNAVLSLSKISFNCSNIGSNTVTLTASSNGISPTCTATITVTDATNPIVTCPADVTVGCDKPTGPSQTGAATGTDNCGSPAITFVDVSTQGGSGCIKYGYVIDRTWTATDAGSKKATCVQTITIEDKTGPVIVCPANSTIACGNATDPSATGMPTATDNCMSSSEITITFSEVVTPGCGSTSTISRNWTATDLCNNSSSCSQLITVVDNTGPTITCPANVTVECSGATDPAATGSATATDACDANSVITFSDAITPGCGQSSSIARTWTATDACGNASPCTQTITVEDKTDPAITCPAGVAVSCDAATDPSATGMATATDACDNAPVITFSDASTQGASGCALYSYVITRTWTATDACGNSTPCTQTITVGDNADPVITCPADVSISCDETTDPANTGMATAADACDNAPVITFADVSTQGGSGCAVYSYTITRTWTATDACGNDASCIQTITVVDNTAPAITCPANVSVECDASSDPAATGTATASDACDNAPVITFGDTYTPIGNSVGSISRLWTATDACGNPSTCTQIVSVIDSDDPTFTVPANTTIQADANCAFNSDISITGDVTDEDDNCATGIQATFNDVVTPVAGSTNKLITRTWTLDDGNGNVVNKDQLITVEDNIPFTFNLLGDNPIDIARFATTPIPGFEAFDNCLGDLTASVTVDSSQLDRTIAATYNVTYTLTFVDPTLGQNINTTLTRVVNITGTSSTQPLTANICSGSSFNIASLVRDFSLQARRFNFYTVDPTTPGATRFATSLAFRGVARTQVMVSPTTTTTYWVRTVYMNGSFADGEILINVSSCGGGVNPIVALEGAFDASLGTMRNSLQTGSLLPLTEPYTGLGYTFVDGGGEQVTASVLQQQSIVDWVVVELRDPASPATVLHSRAALLRTDGRIVDLDGTSVVIMATAPDGMYYLAIKHRNHLSVMSDLPLRLRAGSLTQFDFSDPTVNTYGTGNTRLIQNGKAFMYAGDADGNGQIQNTDDVMQWSPSAGLGGYQPADYNLDGQVQNTDRVFIWNHNVGRGSAVPK
ncbi:MAG: hypothetical protein AB8F95_00680 [Bacteroidia bacterium]